MADSVAFRPGERVAPDRKAPSVTTTLFRPLLPGDRAWATAGSPPRWRSRPPSGRRSRAWSGSSSCSTWSAGDSCSASIAPHHYQLGGTGVFGAGLGLTAYTLGMRHAFDADHIAAIDNTTRKLMADGKRPLSVGFWFSLGHSSIVFGLCLLLSLGVKALAGQVENDNSRCRRRPV